MEVQQHITFLEQLECNNFPSRSCGLHEAQISPVLLFAFFFECFLKRKIHLVFALIEYLSLLGSHCLTSKPAFTKSFISRFSSAFLILLGTSVRVDLAVLTSLSSFSMSLTAGQLLFFAKSSTVSRSLSCCVG